MGVCKVLMRLTCLCSTRSCFESFFWDFQGTALAKCTTVFFQGPFPWSSYLDHQRALGMFACGFFVILLYCLEIVSCRSNFLFPALPFMFLPSPLNFCLLFPSLTNPYCLSSTSPLLLLLFFFNSQASEFSCSRFVSLVGFEAVRHFFWHPMDLLAPFSSLHSSPS